MELSTVTFGAFISTLVFSGLLWFFFSRKKTKCHLPPGPPGWPIVGNLLQITLSGQKFHVYTQKLRQKYGPIYAIRLGSRPMIMIAGHDLAYEALIQKGSIFASRPPATGVLKLYTCNQMSINSAAYGSHWRTMRRNLVSETLSANSIKSFRKGREWGMEILIEGLRKEAAEKLGFVKLVDHLRHAVFCILLYMCFGVRLEEKTVREVEEILRELILSLGDLSLDDLFPALRVFYRKRWERMQGMRRRQVGVIVELVNQRRAALAEGEAAAAALECRAYVDSLFSVTVEGGRSLSDAELVTLCSEFLNAGTDTTSTTLQWVIANLVKHQEIQAELYREIVRVVGKERVVEEEDVQRMPYLEAVVKETLRRHPPSKVVLTHAVTEACTVGGFDIPANALVNFSIWEMANDPKVWENPSEFRPDRFMSAEVDLTGSKEIKMMPFGVGRRICPGLGLAMLHLQLVVARLVQKLSWEEKPGEGVDFAEVEEFTIVMKNPLQALIKERT
uniref:CYP77F35 n=1 Tax=Taxus chinensis TaxID=29808 RepID=A0A291FB17_TAXCH|nr:CYP77F35 [Taxus chinensis]